MRRSLILGLMVSVVAPLAALGADRGSPQWRTMVVEQYGRMHEVLGSSAARARPLAVLSEVLRKNPQAVAVGALAGLQGEITILDGKVWIARPEGAGLRVSGPLTTSADRAAFLVVANVEAWEEIPIKEPLAGAALERFIPGRARQRGLDPDNPFPFVIEGTFTDAQMHVINGVCPMKPGTVIPDDKQPWRHQLIVPQTMKVVGFYAPVSVGNLTHPGTSIHVHALVEVNAQIVTAHVERLAVAPGAVVRIPTRKP